MRCLCSCSFQSSVRFGFAAACSFWRGGWQCRIRFFFRCVTFSFLPSSDSHCCLHFLFGSASRVAPPRPAPPRPAPLLLSHVALPTPGAVSLEHNTPSWTPSITTDQPLIMRVGSASFSQRSRSPRLRRYFRMNLYSARCFRAQSERDRILVAAALREPVRAHGFLRYGTGDSSSKTK